ncbi:uncharacterized protein BDR25DRAFT_205859 [Lindgomyces ingoldianus]|uniref:Uncharacterized protein n=1 Tax=Lindgomyces ingoldianus TaxID=673940 RepID=A0ACB6RG07_9PLEO|nr:uncharacterized protein BDR25DRAFT_205859 [Lindgomyces ingoldianus]KAF2477655.1 hypothetical protein BDR25DRAFT_205859 [Lindgomyces ingoldianus]
MDNLELAIEQPITDYSTSIYKSQRAAAKTYSIPWSTLQVRLKDATNSTISHQHQQRLTPDQDGFSVKWILGEATRDG